MKDGVDESGRHRSGWMRVDKWMGGALSKDADKEREKMVVKSPSVPSFSTFLKIFWKGFFFYDLHFFSCAEN